ncbi:DUF3152 domain-containing protein [Streptomyces sp. NPDC098781]|uniref:DUF3152 domain-containing protein n=1 Tax=Streptomyces sp. NPDC098781 TaxID=3366097 RepID=UPI0037F24A70
MRERRVSRRPRARGRRAGHRRRGSRQPKLIRAFGVALVGSILCGLAIVQWIGGNATVSESAVEKARLSVPPRGAVPHADRSSPSQHRTASPAEPTKSAEPPEPPKPSEPPEVPVSGAGTFTTAQASGSPVGRGPLRRYSVLVEDGIDVSAEEAAAQIQTILAHERSWGAHGRGSFQLVSSNADFVIKIATPDTADRLCLPLDTGGELNCETLDGVVVNLRRWVLGSPQFDGPPEEYRHLIINHEVGHEIGIRTHMGCPGPGQLAPVMMQQIKGLNGCLSNAWPYDEDGNYITGPIV